MAHLAAVLLDVDGTLIDSNGAHARAWVAAFAEARIRVSTERVRWMIGMGGDRILAELAGLEADDARAATISRRRRELFLADHLGHCAPQPGARELLLRLRDEGLRRIVASSAEAQELQPLLARAGVADLVEDAATSDDAGASKPAPDIVCAALARAGVSPASALLLGDTPYDIAAARRAGVGTIALRCGGWDDGALAGALAVYDTPGELLAAYDDSPLAARWELRGATAGSQILL